MWVVWLRSGCTRSWLVTQSRGQIRLVVLSGVGNIGGKSSVTLPLAWAAETVSDAIALITELHQQVEARFHLRAAFVWINGSVRAAAPTSSTQWALLMKWLHDDRRP